MVLWVFTEPLAIMPPTDECLATAASLSYFPSLSKLLESALQQSCELVSIVP